MRDSARPPIRDYRSSFAGMIGMAMLLFLCLGVVGAAPGWVIVSFVGGWLLMFALACRWFVRHPRRVLLLPLFGFLVWLLVVSLGTRQWGW